MLLHAQFSWVKRTLVEEIGESRGPAGGKRGCPEHASLRITGTCWRWHLRARTALLSIREAQQELRQSHRTATPAVQMTTDRTWSRKNKSRCWGRMTSASPAIADERRSDHFHGPGGSVLPGVLALPHHFVGLLSVLIYLNSLIISLKDRFMLALPPRLVTLSRTIPLRNRHPIAV